MIEKVHVVDLGMSMSELSEADLNKIVLDVQKEQKRRVDEKERLRREAVVANNIHVGEHAAVLLPLVPNHSLKDCSDDRMCMDDRCLRCALLQAVEKKWFEGGKMVFLSW